MSVLLSVPLFLAACTPSAESTSPQVPTDTLWMPTNTLISNATLPASRAPTPSPRTLTICLGAEPDSLFVYGGRRLVKSSVLEAIYDGPIDPLGFDYQPVILEKLPSLADGDARLELVGVKAGDWVVNDAGVVVQLAVGEVVRPFGCNTPDCAITWDGASLEMAQLSADFTLLERIKWSDGESLTADDSIFSFRVAQECENGQAPCGGFGLPVHPQPFDTFERTAAYTAVDERTVRWTGLPGFLDPNYRANFFIPLPEHALGHFSFQQLFEAEESAWTPLGWGPYIIDQWIQGDHIELHKNPNYFRAAEGLPLFDRLVFRFTGENSAVNIAKILSGDCDLIDQDAQLDDVTQLLLAMDHEGLLQAHSATGMVWEHADFNLLPADYDDGYQMGADPPNLFGDVRTRQAIALCMDRQAVVDQVLFGLSEVPDTYLPAIHPLFNPDADFYDFDRQNAFALLEKVGWLDLDGDPATPRVAQGVPNVPNGTPLAFIYRTTTSTQRQQVVPILAESLARCGVQLKVEYFEAAEFFAEPPEGDLFSRRFDMAEFAWLTRAVPSCDLFMTENIPGDPQLKNPDGSPRFPKGWKGQNNSGYSNPEFDLACRAALEALPGQPGYIENHMLAQKIFARDLPVIPLFHRISVTAARADLCGYRMDPSAISDTWNVEAFDYGEGCGNQ